MRRGVLVSGAFVVAGFVGMFFYSCQTQPLSREASTDDPPEINIVLQFWDESDREAALERFIELHRSTKPDAEFRAFSMSENEFVRLPEHIRQRHQEEKLERSRNLRQFAGFAHENSVRWHKEGNHADARELSEALKRLGRANSGEELTELADMTGEAILGLAKRPLPDE